MEGYVYELKGEQGKSRFDELQEQIDSLDTRVDALEGVVVTFVTHDELSSELAHYVTLDTTQTITADKDITGNVRIGGAQGKTITLGQSADNPRVTLDQWSGVVGFTDTEGGFNEFNPCDSDFGAIPSFDRLGVYDLNVERLDVYDNATIENLRVKTVKAGNTTVKGKNVYNFEGPCTFNFGLNEGTPENPEIVYYGSFVTYDPDYDCPRFNYLATGALTVESNLEIPSAIRAYTPNVGTYTITFPAKNGTVALTSDLGDYLPLTGGGTIVPNVGAQEQDDRADISAHNISVRKVDPTDTSTVINHDGINVSKPSVYGGSKVTLDGFESSFGKYGREGYRYAADGIHKIGRSGESSPYTFPSESGTLALGELKTTWSELKALRDGGKLVPGRQYRITDYVCTTTQTNTSSAGHQFDIVVVADTISKLNEVARACLHEGDTYFANSKLEAWQLWYCLDNDDTRFEWADTSYVEIVGTIVANEVSWDRYEAGDFPSYQHPYAWKSSDGARVYTDSPTPSVSDEAYISNSHGPSYAITEIVMRNKYTGKGVIYRMIDEFGNDCPYDFKNILFTDTAETPKYTNAYTFSYPDHNIITDASLSRDRACYNNKIEEAVEAYHLRKKGPNFIVFFPSSGYGFSCSNNIFKGNCENITIGQSCSYNTFTRCHDIILGSSCSFNTFGNGCSDITLGSYNQKVKFEGNCYNIKFTKGNALLDYCRAIVIESDCHHVNITTTSSTSMANALRYIHVHSSVSGTQAEYKTITVEANLKYTTDVYAVGSTEMFV